jgi:hypothetical protein
VAQDRIKWRTIVNVIINLRNPYGKASICGYITLIYQEGFISRYLWDEWVYHFYCMRLRHFPYVCVKYRNRYSSVAATTDYVRAGRPRFDCQQWKMLLFSTVSRPALGPSQPPIQWVPEALSRGVRRQGHEADHSPPFSAEVKNGEVKPPLPHTSSWHSA